MFIDYSLMFITSEYVIYEVIFDLEALEQPGYDEYGRFCFLLRPFRDYSTTPPFLFPDVLLSFW
jgi:hypothetical protein